MQLPEYMQTHFAGLQLGPDLFYRWTVGVRFELNADHWPNVKWEAVLDRAATLYETVFRPGDIGFVVSGHEFEFELKSLTVGKLPEFRNSVFTLSRKESLGLHGIAGRQRLTSYEDRSTRIISTFRWTEIEPRRIKYKRILHAIMNRDFPTKRPQIGDYVYFINRSRNIILRMYDDRGLDLIAPQIADLQPIYQVHKAWVLSFDSAAIGRMFETNEPISHLHYRR